jgi:hypothetical protein
MNQHGRRLNSVTPIFVCFVLLMQASCPLGMLEEPYLGASATEIKREWTLPHLVDTVKRLAHS